MVLNAGLHYLCTIAVNEIDTLGDTSAIADPSVVTQLIENRANK